LEKESRNKNLSEVLLYVHVIVFQTVIPGICPRRNAPGKNGKELSLTANRKDVGFFTYIHGPTQPPIKWVPGAL
jgi:hypothetical protein